MSLTVNNVIVLSLGGIGHRMAQAYQEELTKRHPQHAIPTIQFVPLMEENKRKAEGRLVLPSLGIEVRPSYNTSQLAYNLSQEIEWDDDERRVRDQLEDMPRLRGQISLYQNIYEIQYALEEARRVIFSDETLKLLEEREIPLQNPDHTYVYILFSLADPFMSGLLPDLPFVVQHILSEGRPEDKPVHISLVAALPGFKGEAEGLSERDPNFARQRIDVRTKIHAWSAATLREIDYFLGQPRTYARKFTDTIDIATSRSPLGQGRIFLLENTNENGSRLDDINVMASMVGDWLYHATLTQLNRLLTPGNVSQKPYSSFGQSSLSVPINAWTQRAAVDLQVKMLEEIIPIQLQEEATNLAVIRGQLGLSAEAIRDKLLDGTEYEQIKIQTGMFRGTRLTKPDEFLSKVQGRYTSMMRDKLVLLGDTLRRRRSDFTQTHDLEDESSLLAPLKDHILKLLDEPRGGIVRAHLFLKALHQELEDEQRALRAEREGQRDSADAIGEVKREPRTAPKRRRRRPQRKTQIAAISVSPTLNARDDSLVSRILLPASLRRMPGTIKESRQMYFGRSEIATGSRIPFLGLTILLLSVYIPMLLFGIQLYQQTSSRSGAFALTLFAILITFFVVGRAISTLRLARLAVIRTYNRRLQAYREQTVLDVMADLYDDMIVWTSDIRAGVNQTWKMISDLRTDLKERWQPLEDITLLAERYQEGVSESLLRPDLIQFLEKEQTRLSQTEDAVQTLRQKIGPPSVWLADRKDAEELTAQFDAFATDRAADELKRFDLSAILQRTSAEQSQQKFQRALRLSYPYWQYDPTKNLVTDEPLQVIAKSEKSLDVAQYFNQTLSEYHINDPYELIVSSVRHGIALREMRTYTEAFSKAYRLQSASAPHTLHTQPVWSALPDPAEYSSDQGLNIYTLSPLQIYMLGRSLDILHIGELEGDEPDTAISYDGERRTVKVGSTSRAAVERLAQDDKVRQEIRGEIAEQWEFQTAQQAIEVWLQTAHESEWWVRLNAKDFLVQMEDDSRFL